MTKFSVYLGIKKEIIMSHSIEANKYAGVDLCLNCDRYLGPQHYKSRDKDNKEEAICKICKCLLNIPTIKAVRDLKVSSDIRDTKDFRRLVHLLTTEGKGEFSSNESDEQAKIQEIRKRLIDQPQENPTPPKQQKTSQLPNDVSRKNLKNQNFDQKIENIQDLKDKVHKLIENHLATDQSTLSGRLKTIRNLLITYIQEKGRKLFLLYCLDSQPFTMNGPSLELICKLIHHKEDLPSPEDCAGKDENLKKNRVLELLMRCKNKLQSRVNREQRKDKQSKGRTSAKALGKQCDCFKKSITDLTVKELICEVLRIKIERLQNIITDREDPLRRKQTPNALLILELFCHKNNSTESILEFLKEFKNNKHINIFNHTDLQDTKVSNDYKQKLIQAERRMQGLQHGDPDNDHIKELENFIDSLIAEKVSIEPRDMLEIFAEEIAFLKNDHNPAN
jgi:hypothetical protein